MIFAAASPWCSWLTTLNHGSTPAVPRHEPRASPRTLWHALTELQLAPRRVPVRHAAQIRVQAGLGRIQARGRGTLLLCACHLRRILSEAPEADCARGSAQARGTRDVGSGAGPLGCCAALEERLSADAAREPRYAGTRGGRRKPRCHRWPDRAITLPSLGQSRARWPARMPALVPSSDRPATLCKASSGQYSQLLRWYANRKPPARPSTEARRRTLREPRAGRVGSNISAGHRVSSGAPDDAREE